MVEGDRVRLKAEAPLRVDHPELGGAIGIVGSLFRGNGDALLHVRFAPPVNLLVLNVAASQFEPADDIAPRLRRG